MLRELALSVQLRRKVSEGVICRAAENDRPRLDRLDCDGLRVEFGDARSLKCLFRNAVGTKQFMRGAQALLAETANRLCQLVGHGRGPASKLQVEPSK